MQPRTPNPELKRTLLKYTVLSDGIFANSIVPEIDRQVFDEEKKRIEGQLEAGFSKLRADAQLTTVQDARGRVRAVASMGSTSRRLEVSLKELFTIVYHKAPESFFTQYRHMSGNHMRSGVIDLIPVLEANNVTNAALGLGKVSKEIVDKFLEGDWTVLSRQLQLQTPTSSHIKSAWDYLENTFQEGEAVNIDKALAPLLNAPYGYDYNTLSLLFACWYGLNRRDLDISVANRQVSLANLSTTGRSKPDDFISKLGTGRLWRRKRSDIDKKVREAVERIEVGNLSKEQADRDHNRLRKFLDEDDGTNSRLSEDVQSAFNKVVSGLERLETYDTLATSIDKGSEKAKSVSEYATQLKQVDRLPELVTVRSELPPLETVRRVVMTRLDTFTQIECEKNEKLKNLTDYGLKVNALGGLKKELERLNLSGLATRVAQALERLEAAKNELDIRGRLQNELNMIQQLQFKNVGLAQLRENKTKLETYENFGVESVIEAAQLRLAQVKESIDKLGTFSGLLWKRIDAVKTSSEARALGEEILRKRSLYENTTDLGYLDDDRERTRRLEAYFTQFEKPIQPKSPAEVVELTTQLESLQQTFSENNTLSDAQIEHAQTRLERIQAFASSRRGEAQMWLEGITADLAAGNNLKALRNKLASPPAFLAESLQPQLAELSEQVEMALVGEAQTAGQLEAIKQLSDRGTLVQLRENLARLDDYETAQQSVQAAASAKRDVLTKKITRLTEQLSEWQEKQAKMTRPRDVDQLIGEVQRAEGTYTGSELEAKVGEPPGST